MTILHNIECEQELLGCLLNHNDVIDRIEGLKDHHFFEPLHQRIFAEIETSARKGEQINAVRLKTAIQDDEGLTEAGGDQYLTGLVAASCAPLMAVDYAKTLIDLYYRREIAELAKYSQDSIADFSVPASELLGELEGKLMQTEEAATGNTFKTAFEASKIALQSMFAEKGTLTGLADLDKSLRGLKPGHVYILAGRPGMGKTALGIQIAVNIAKAGMISQFHTMEMGADEIMARAVSKQIDIPYSEYMGARHERAIERIGRVKGLNDLPLLIDDRSALNSVQIATAVRRAKRIYHEKPYGLLAIDYLGLMKDSGRFPNKVHSLGEICKDLKNLARKEEIPVLLLAQLSRGVESRENKRPMMSDLRDSGEIEQDASVIMFVYRDAYYAKQILDASEEGSKDWGEALARIEANQNTLEVLVAKNRNGPCSTVRLYSEIEFNHFTNLTYSG